MRRTETIDFRDFLSASKPNAPTHSLTICSFYMSPVAVLDLPPALKIGYFAVLLAASIGLLSTLIERMLIRRNKPSYADAVSAGTRMFVKGSGTIAAGWLVFETLRRFTP